MPELMQDDLTVEAVRDAVRAQLYDPDHNRAMLARFDALRGVLANQASVHAAQAVIEHAHRRRA